MPNNAINNPYKYISGWFQVNTIYQRNSRLRFLLSGCYLEVSLVNFDFDSSHF
jgi:hypothetical protein